MLKGGGPLLLLSLGPAPFVELWIMVGITWIVCSGVIYPV